MFPTQILLETENETYVTAMTNVGIEANITTGIRPEACDLEPRESERMRCSVSKRCQEMLLFKYRPEIEI